MEVYILDGLLRREQVVDKFESLIWTERFQEVGDFELLLNSTWEARSQFLTGTQIAINKSHRVMTVETVEDTSDEDGRTLLKVKGNSMESILHDRVARQGWTNTTEGSEWAVSGTPGDIARYVFDQICRVGTLSLDDKIPFLQPGTIFPADTLPEPGTPITVRLPVQTVYKVIKDICDTYDLGFRLVRNFDTSQVYFNIYAGNDRTTRQSTLAPIIFSPDFDNLQNTAELSTIQDSKNVAYVFSSRGTRMVYGLNVDPDVYGFERRVLLVDASSDITDETPEGDIQSILQQRGEEELFRSRSFSGFDGEIEENSNYIYGVDYTLGDLVELRNIDNIITYKRVTEQIFVHDESGERSYPTLSMNAFVSTNTWLSQQSNRVWEDFGATEYWADQ